MKPKRFLVFAYCRYYPLGGRQDFVGPYDDQADADKAGRDSGRDYYDILDLETGAWL